MTKEEFWNDTGLELGESIQDIVLGIMELYARQQADAQSIAFVKWLEKSDWTPLTYHGDTTVLWHDGKDVYELPVILARFHAEQNPKP